MRMVQVGGGAKRLASILGGHTDVALFSVQEFIKYEPSGLLPLNVFSKQRNALLPDIPTAIENGVDVVATDGRIWIAPKETPQDRIDLLIGAFRAAMEKPDVKKTLEEYGINPSFIDPDAIVTELNRVRDEVIPLVPKARSLKQ
jgi:tripartite-type tricarboxylate transporter receptor subunit TctC